MENEHREDQWISRKSFIFVSIGAAMGLGNLWRFPFQLYQNGGGIFLFPYIFALLTAGIPLLILEYALGHKMKGSMVLAYRSIDKKWEWVGWFQVIIPGIILIFYTTIVSWSLNYLFFVFDQSWGNNPYQFFSAEFLGVSDSPWQIFSINWRILFASGFVWVLIYFIGLKPVSFRIEKISNICIPVLITLMIILMIRALTLEGAMQGLNHLFKPDFFKLFSPGVWIAAYSQVFYSIAIALGVMAAFASYLPKKSDITNNAVITVLANASINLIAGITVFATLGFISDTSNIPFDQMVNSGPGVIFATFPKAISQMSMFKGLFGFAFFFSIFIAGVISCVALLESFTRAVMEKFPIKREKLMRAVCIIGGTGSILYATHAGVLILDIVDHFIGYFGILLCGLAEVIVFGHIYGTKKLREHINQYSDFKLSPYWDISIKYMTPLILGYLLLRNLIIELGRAYQGYPISAIIIMGWFCVIGMMFLGIYMSYKPWKSVS